MVLGRRVLAHHGDGLRFGSSCIDWCAVYLCDRLVRLLGVLKTHELVGIVQYVLWGCLSDELFQSGSSWRLLVTLSMLAIDCLDEVWEPILIQSPDSIVL